jgi:hypothetical protein
MRRFSTGQPVVVEELQRSTNAQSRDDARTITAADAAVVYHYMTVMESREKGTLVLLTQHGELHVTHNNNPSVRRASWWERLTSRDRFPRLRRSKG